MAGLAGAQLSAAALHCILSLCIHLTPYAAPPLLQLPSSRTAPPQQPALSPYPPFMVPARAGQHTTALQQQRLNTCTEQARPTRRLAGGHSAAGSTIAKPSSSKASRTASTSHSAQGDLLRQVVQPAADSSGPGWLADAAACACADDAEASSAEAAKPRRANCANKKRVKCTSSALNGKPPRFVGCQAQWCC